MLSSDGDLFRGRARGSSTSPGRSGQGPERAGRAARELEEMLEKPLREPGEFES